MMSLPIDEGLLYVAARKGDTIIHATIPITEQGGAGFSYLVTQAALHVAKEVIVLSEKKK